MAVLLPTTATGQVPLPDLEKVGDDAATASLAGFLPKFLPCLDLNVFNAH